MWKSSKGGHELQRTNSPGKLIAHKKVRGDADDMGRMILIPVSEETGNSKAVIRQGFRKIRFQMIDDTSLEVQLEWAEKGDVGCSWHPHGDYAQAC